MNLYSMRSTSKPPLALLNKFYYGGEFRLWYYMLSRCRKYLFLNWCIYLLIINMLNILIEFNTIHIKMTKAQLIKSEVKGFVYDSNMSDAKNTIELNKQIKANLLEVGNSELLKLDAILKVRGILAENHINYKEFVNKYTDPIDVQTILQGIKDGLTIFEGGVVSGDKATLSLDCITLLQKDSVSKRKFARKQSVCLSYSFKKKDGLKMKLDTLNCVVDRVERTNFGLDDKGQNFNALTITVLNNVDLQRLALEYKNPKEQDFKVVKVEDLGISKRVVIELKDYNFIGDVKDDNFNNVFDDIKVGTKLKVELNQNGGASDWNISNDTKQA